jgi:hypothetical protein
MDYLDINEAIQPARLPDEICVRIDVYAKTLGIKTRSDAVRSLLLLGLATHYEAERKCTASTRKGKS